ncbi:hypothetical protein [Cryobacterium sp. TMT1-2-2]|uniref:hypothetical protein n=1 Tax=Cryobacterium sp. TMT1-2-2 TaxID=1259233 RepID=UPI00141AF87F|nr:hypothetical protein [Cryobacterium sp. TMT1-2-2]
MDDFVTPADLARELGVSQLRIRNFLRTMLGKLTPPETRWRLDDHQANAVREQFR